LFFEAFFDFALKLPIRQGFACLEPHFGTDAPLECVAQGYVAARCNAVHAAEFSTKRVFGFVRKRSFCHAKLESMQRLEVVRLTQNLMQQADFTGVHLNVETVSQHAEV
jgi:hypothetical protein